MRTVAGEVIERPGSEIEDDPPFDELFRAAGANRPRNRKKQPPTGNEEESPPLGASDHPRRVPNMPGDKGAIGTSNEPGYTGGHGGTVGDETAILQAASDLLSRMYPRERVEKALGDLARDAERQTTDRATGEPRPVAPAVALEWPTAKWKDATEKILGKKRGIITFLKREWEPFIQNTGKVVTRDILASHDPEAEQALTRHLETHEFPEDISIIYPERLMRIAAERPELLRAMLSVCGMAYLR